MERDAFLKKIADRLDRPRQKTPPQRDVSGVPSFYRDRPFGDEAPVDKVIRFRTELTALGSDVYIVDTMTQAADVLQQLITEMEPKIIVTWAPEAFQGWETDWLWEHSAVHPAGGEMDFIETAKKADLGITTVQYAVANTGTIVLCATRKQPRAVSLLPAVHVALIRESQIVPRMGDVFPMLRASKEHNLPSSITFISGPSRSADIEGDLSIGVHGPVAVRAIVVRGV